jgi:HlyD family secretion protein
MNYRRIATALIVLAGITILTACGNSATADNKEVQMKNVNVVTVAKSNIVVENEFAGEVKAGEETGVISKTPGKVKNLFVKVGDMVKEGDVLFTLDGDDLKAQLDQASAAVQAAAVGLDKTSNSGFQQQILQAQIDYDQSKSNYDDINRDFQKNQSLFEVGSLSKKEMDDTKSKLDLAKKKLDTSGKNLEILKNSSGPQSIDIAKSQLEQTEANKQLINIQLDNLSVKAPISGVVTTKNINVGEGVSMASPAVVISNTDNMDVEMNIPENLVTKFSDGQKLNVTVPSLDNKVFKSEVETVYPSLDAETKNYRIKIKLLDKSDLIKQGMQAKIKLAVEGRDDVIVIPNQAFTAENGVYYVLVVKDNRIVKTPIKIGLSNDRWTEVLQGINVNDNIVIEGQSFLSDGEQVKILAKS